MKDLRECPFCGGEAEVKQVSTMFGVVVVKCNGCGATAPTPEKWEARHGPVAPINGQGAPLVYQQSESGV